mmetsp:Transcript_56238/g.89245  ORF Transcript_56238/g.89245 Transcript_56238/m.89245 type:complete len:302 (+) Transcript_56238:105-1010(+)
MAKKKKKNRRPRGIPSRASLASGLFQIFSFIPAFVSIFIPWWENKEDDDFMFEWTLFALSGKPASVSLDDVSRGWDDVCDWSDMDDFCGRWMLSRIMVFIAVVCNLISVIVNFIGLCKRDFITLCVAYGFLVVVFISDIIVFIGATGTPAGLSQKDVGGGLICLILSFTFSTIALIAATVGLFKFRPVPREDTDGLKIAPQGYNSPQQVQGAAPPAAYGQIGYAGYGYGQQKGYGQQPPPPQPVGYGQMAQQGGYMQQAPGGYMQAGGSSWPAAQGGYNNNFGLQPVPVQGYGYNAAGAKE